MHERATKLHPHCASVHTESMPTSAPEPPLDALMTFLSVARLGRYTAAAEVLAATYLSPGDDMRIDVMLLAPGQRPRHLENVWHGG